MKHKRLFVVGMSRSGHTWFTNLIGNHPDIIKLVEPEAGCFEANMLDLLPAKYGSIKKPDDYVGLIELWSQTDLFKATGVDKEIFYKLKPRPTSYRQLFKILMDRSWLRACPRSSLRRLQVTCLQR